MRGNVSEGVGQVAVANVSRNVLIFRNAKRLLYFEAIRRALNALEDARAQSPRMDCHHKALNKNPRVNPRLQHLARREICLVHGNNEEVVNVA